MASYEQTLKLFAKYLSDNVKITDATKLTEKIYIAYIISIQERGKYYVIADDKSKRTNIQQNRKDLGKKVSPSMIDNYTRNKKVFYSFLFKQGFIKKNPLKNSKNIKFDRKSKENIDFKENFNKITLGLNKIDGMVHKLSEVKENIHIKIYHR